MPSRNFLLDDAAVAYALAAERILGSSSAFLAENCEVVPIFVSHLFQSLEISIKHAGIASCLITEHEARAKENGGGHQIEELATLVCSKLGSNKIDPLLNALTFGVVSKDAQIVIRDMICGEAFKKTRQIYTNRKLGYAQIADGDFALYNDLVAWVGAVKATAQNLSNCVDILKQWKEKGGNCASFAIFVKSVNFSDCAAS